MQKAIKRSTLLPYVGRVVEGTALLSHVAKRGRCTAMLLLNVKIGSSVYDHIRVEVKKDAYINQKIKEIKFKATVQRYNNGKKVGLKDLVFI